MKNLKTKFLHHIIEKETKEFKMKDTILTEHQFHVIWTAAVGKPGYDKKLFQNIFEELIESGKIIPTKHS